MRNKIILLVYLLGFILLNSLVWSATTDSNILYIPREHLATPEDTDRLKWDDSFRTALKFTISGKFNDAESIYREIAASAQSDNYRARALYYLGELYQHHIENLELAIPIYRNIIDSYPLSNSAEDAQFQLGVVYYHLKKFEQAYSELSTYKSNFPEGQYRENAQFMFRQTAHILGLNIPVPDSISQPAQLIPVEHPVRIALSQRAGTVTISSDMPYSIWCGTTSMQFYRAQKNNNTPIQLISTGWKIGHNEFNADELLVVSENQSPLYIDDKPYRGKFRLMRNNNQINVINIVSLEEYLYGVVPREVPQHWPMEALKAQAIAARTYALSRMEVRANRTFDMVATQSDQVYGGIDSERERTTQAVNATRGIIIVYDGEPITSYYHSNSGGMTEDSLAAFGFRRSYLRSINDPHSRNTPGYQWSLRMTGAEIRRRLQNEGYDIGQINSITISETTPTGRAEQIKIFHSRGVREFSARDFRWHLDSRMLRSTMFSIRKRGNSYYFNGKGFGHGVGLSQWGAYNMAQKGKSHKDILAYYYRGTELCSL